MKCPLHTNMANELAECDAGCALLMNMRENGNVRACAVAVIASKVDSPLGYWLHRKYVLPANVVQEGADE